MRVHGKDYRQQKKHLLGTHRIRDPMKTVDTFWPLRHRLGITRLANVTGLDHVGVPVYQCIRPNSKTLSVSQGKGLTAGAAKASALMESIESWHAETMAVNSRYESPKLLSERARLASINRLPQNTRRPLNPEIPIPWVEGFELNTSQSVWVPYEAVSLNRLYRVRYTNRFQDNSNGLASGNHLLEAISHGICEVVERDADTLFHYDMSDPLGTSSLVDPRTVDDPACRSVLERLQAADLVVAINDITSDVGIPCFRCLVVDQGNAFRPLGSAMGQGCHPSPEIALLRSLTEAAQSRLTLIAGARDDFVYTSYFSAQHSRASEDLVELLRESEPTRDFRTHRSLATDTFEGDIEFMLESLSRVGCGEVIVVDLTRDDIGVPVVKILIPGLEGIHGGRYVAGPRARLKLRVEEG